MTGRLARASRLALAWVILTTLSVAIHGGPLRESFDLQVPMPPTPVTIDGKAWLVYELHLTNFSRDVLTLRGLETIDADSGLTIDSMRDDVLSRRVGRLVTPSNADDAKQVGPGMRAVIYIEMVRPPAAVPRALRHRVEYARVGAEHDPVHLVEGASVAVRRESPPILGAPLRGGPWAAVYEPSWPRGHRRVLYAVDGGARIPGRFAVDWVRLDAEGRQARGDADMVANALGYGAEVLAVVDGVVAAARDDVAESRTISAQTKHAIGDASGNYIALDLGGARYVFYEHLKPGSVRVKPGQRVRRGDVIAALGFTGDSTGPHLHLHVADGTTPLGAEGVPFLLDRFEVLGAYRDIANLGNAPWHPVATGRSPRTRELPAPNVVVDFSGSR